MTVNHLGPVTGLHLHKNRIQSMFPGWAWLAHSVPLHAKFSPQTQSLQTWFVVKFNNIRDRSLLTCHGYYFLISHLFPGFRSPASVRILHIWHLGICEYSMFNDLSWIFMNLHLAILVGTSIPRSYLGDGRLGTVENTRQSRRNYRSALMGSTRFVSSL